MAAENPFASPRTIVDATAADSGNFLDAWRSGNLLVVGKSAQLPDRCIKCNAPALGFRNRFALSWHPRWVLLGLLGGLLPYLLLAIILRKKLTFFAGVCPHHRRRRQIGVLLGIAGSLLSVAMIFFGAMASPRSNQVLFILAGPIFLLVSLVVGIVVAQIISARRIDKQHAWIKGVSADFLAGLPDFADDLD